MNNMSHLPPCFSFYTSHYNVFFRHNKHSGKYNFNGYIYTSENPVRKSINPTTTTAVRGKDMLFIKEFVYRIFFTLNILVCVECHDIIVHDCMPKW